MKLTRVHKPNSTSLPIFRFIYKKHVLIYDGIDVEGPPLLFISVVPQNKMKTSHQRTVPIGTII